ncbi:MAG TPA: hypothetical protein VN643_18410 [Pyrinomonadaceae bacterium]|nr:hypothetical protein [Pyrinomonadaceae bacterium]
MSEKSCGIIHNNVEDAIKHAYLGLVQGNKHLLSEPYWGTRGGNIGNIGKVIGWATPDSRKRWRLDFDPAKGVHLNEEDFTFAAPKKIVHSIRCSFLWAMTCWNKWTSRYDKPPHVVEAAEEIDRRRRQGFK